MEEARCEYITRGCMGSVGYIINHYIDSRRPVSFVDIYLMVEMDYVVDDYLTQLEIDFE